MHHNQSLNLAPKLALVTTTYEKNILPMIVIKAAAEGLEPKFLDRTSRKAEASRTVLSPRKWLSTRALKPYNSHRIR